MRDNERPPLTETGSAVTGPREERLAEALREAYPAGEASDALRERIGAMAVQEEERGRARVPRWRPAQLGWAGLTVALAGALAFGYYLLHRPGEEAIQLIPADALLVVTLDTNPSLEQAALFARINQALKREGVAAKVDSTLTQVVDAPPISQEMRPYVTTNFALAMIPTGSVRSINDATPVFFLDVKDVDGARSVLARHGQPTRFGRLIYYRMPKGEFQAAIITHYLALSPKPEILGRVAAAADGEVPVVAGLPEYKEAREALPKDANLMAFISPTGMALADETTRTAGVSALRDLRWLALSGTLRDEGIKIDFRVPVDEKDAKNLAPVAGIAPVDPALLKRLPPDAYGLFGISQPGRYWDYVPQAFAGDAKEKADFTKAVADFGKETGIGVQSNVVPGLSGQTVIAVYPDVKRPDSEADVLAVLDDSHDADPAALAAKLRDYVERTGARYGRSKARFIAETRHGVPTWHLDKAGQKDAEDALGRRLGEMFGDKDDSSDKADGSGAGESFSDTIAFAQIGKTVLMSSSMDLLDRAIAAWIAPGYSLADQAAYRGMQQELTPGAQGLIMVDLASIVKAFHIDKSDHDPSGVIADCIRGLFGNGGTGLVASARFDGRFETGSVFVPLDYERAIRLVGEFGKPDGDGKDD